MGRHFCMMETNVYGMLRVSQAFAPKLAANGGGAFLNLLSVAMVARAYAALEDGKMVQRPA
jgi:short-subunit dehydrogenase